MLLNSTRVGFAGSRGNRKIMHRCDFKDCWPVSTNMLGTVRVHIWLISFSCRYHTSVHVEISVVVFGVILIFAVDLLTKVARKTHDSHGIFVFEFWKREWPVTVVEKKMCAGGYGIEDASKLHWSYLYVVTSRIGKLLLLLPLYNANVMCHYKGKMSCSQSICERVHAVGIGSNRNMWRLPWWEAAYCFTYINTERTARVANVI